MSKINQCEVWKHDCFQVDGDAQLILLYSSLKAQWTFDPPEDEPNRNFAQVGQTWQFTENITVWISSSLIFTRQCLASPVCLLESAVQADHCVKSTMWRRVAVDLVFREFDLFFNTTNSCPAKTQLLCYQYRVFSHRCELWPLFLLFCVNKYADFFHLFSYILLSINFGLWFVSSSLRYSSCTSCLKAYYSVPLAGWLAGLYRAGIVRDAFGGYLVR